MKTFKEKVAAKIRNRKEFRIANSSENHVRVISSVHNPDVPEVENAKYYVDDDWSVVRITYMKAA